MLEAVLKEYPDDDEVLYHLGNTYFMEGDLLTSEVYFSKAAELNPKSFRAHNNLGVVQKNLGKKESAIRELNLAIELNPKYERAWFNLGILFMEIQPPLLKEASIFLKRAIEMQPNFHKAREKLDECRSIMNEGV
jgi:tetratricopeptide (TPR) repeat protein